MTRHSSKLFKGLRSYVIGASLAIVAAVSFGACSGSSSSELASQGGDARLLRIDVGRLVDVFALKAERRAEGLVLVEKDVLIGPDIQDDRRGSSQKSEEQIVYEFIGVDPDSLQPRLLINRVYGSEKFQSAYDALDKNISNITPGVFGQDTGSQPFSVAARNGAFRLTFSKDLGLTEDFFIARDELGRVIGIRNPEAIQLLEIVQDPNDNQFDGDFVQIPSRIAYKGHQVILDPVLLGNEGKAFNVKNNALGLPESTDNETANIRIAITLEGPLKIRGLLPDPGQGQTYVGRNLAQQTSIIRDMRSGNLSDNTDKLRNGFSFDTVPPRIVGEMAMKLEFVDTTQNRLRLYKGKIKHAIDFGDVVKLFPEGSEGRAVAITDVLADPEDAPDEKHVWVQIRDASAWKPYDPTNKFPELLNLPVAEREAWLDANAPTLVLSTEFSQKDGDEIKNFVNFTPPPVSDEPNKNISPFAALIVRFSKPIDLTTVKPLDTLILATHGNTPTVLDPKLGTPHLIFSQINDEDGSQTSLRVAPPLGFYIDQALRNDNRPYFLHMRGGLEGIRDLAGNPVDFQPINKTQEFQQFEFWLDVRPNAYPDNRVINIARRFLDQDEDESPIGMRDYFGPITFYNGQAIGRPTARSSSFVDDRNQLPSPPNPPFRYCLANQDVLLTAATPFPQAVLNPLNPWGCRLQTMWREIDLSLSRVDPFDFNLDVEQMWYAPFQQGAQANRPFTYDIFDRISLFIGHSERRPSNCVDQGGALPVYTQSGLRNVFWHNFVRSLKVTSRGWTDKDGVDERPDPHVAFRDQTYIIRDQDAAYEPNNINRFIPLPTFEKPYFTFRDERMMLLGGGDGMPTVLSPFGKGAGQYWNAAAGTPFQEDGRVGAVALPLLADFWVYPDKDELPIDQPWAAIGINGWQLSLTVQSSSQPTFRAYSAGGIKIGQNRKQGKTVDPTKNEWENASGGVDPNTGFGTPCCDNNSLWMRADWLKRLSIMTYGFLRLADPHDARTNGKTLYGSDPRLGGETGYDISGTVPRFEVAFEPPLSTLPFGTQIIAEYRGASKGSNGSEFPTEDLFNPLLTGNAHVRYFSNATQRFDRFEWTKKLTSYTRNPSDLINPAFLESFQLTPEEMTLFNFRFIFENNVDSTPPKTPAMDSYVLLYRLEGK